MGLIDILIVIGIIAVAIAGIKWSDKEARKWVRLIEMIHEDDRTGKPKERRRYQWRKRFLSST